MLCSMPIKLWRPVEKSSWPPEMAFRPGSLRKGSYRAAQPASSFPSAQRTKGVGDLYHATKTRFCQSRHLDLTLRQEQNSRHHSFWLRSEEFLLCLRSSSSPFLMRTCPGCSQVSPRCLA